MYNNIERFFKNPENENYYLHAFTSGGRLRVLRIDSKDKNKKGLYGESVTLNEAFKNLEEDAEAGGREYKDVYGKIYPHYVTGAYPNENDKLDCILAEGYTFDITYKGQFHMELNYGRRSKTPKAVMEKVTKTGMPVKFEMDNLEFECKPYKFANGDMGHSTSCLTKVDEVGFDPWYKKLKHIVEADTIYDLLEKMVSELCVLDKEIAWNEI